MALTGITRWVDRVALVTGAGSGIGACISQNLVKHGMTVIGCARNKQPIDVLAQEYINLGYKGKLHSYQCDLTKEDEIEGMFDWIKSNHVGVDVCVNNAGFANVQPLLASSASGMREMLDTNVVALVLCSKLSAQSMLERGVTEGHIFNLNSMLGHSVTGYLNFYTATKFAVTALTDGLRMELAEKGSRIKVTAVSPGRVETKFLYRAFSDPAKAESLYATLQSLTPQDVTDALVHALSAPEHVQIHDILLQPMKTTTEKA